MRWKTIDGWDNYAVSDTGLVMQKTKNPIKYGRKAGLIPQCSASQGGYKQVCLVNLFYKKFFYVHQLVALAFIANPNKYDKVNHKDGNKTNNHFSNLEWCSQRQNVHHALKNGLHQYSQKHNDCRELAELMIRDGCKAKHIQDFTDYSIVHISRIKKEVLSK